MISCNSKSVEPYGTDFVNIGGKVVKNIKFQRKSLKSSQLRKNLNLNLKFQIMRFSTMMTNIPNIWLSKNMKVHLQRHHHLFKLEFKTKCNDFFFFIIEFFKKKVLILSIIFC